MLKYLLLHIFTLLLSTSAYSQTNSSRIVDFYYGGYSDTVVALLTVEVLSIESTTGECIPLNNSTIRIFDENGIIKEYELHGVHKKQIGFSWGWYAIKVEADGYQKLIILDYKSRPDQVSFAKVCLVLGYGVVRESSNPWPDPIPKNGIDTTFYTSGKIESIKKWRNDTLLESIRWHESDQLSYEMRKLNDSTELTYSYYPNGQITFITLWNKGLTVGFRKDYYENGNLKRELLNTETGQLVWTGIDSAGEYRVKEGNSVKSYWKDHEKPSLFGYYKNGKKHGKWKWNNSDGTKFKRYKYRHGELVLYKFYSSDGKLYRKSRYKNGIEKTTYNVWLNCVLMQFRFCWRVVFYFFLFNIEHHSYIVQRQ